MFQQMQKSKCKCFPSLIVAAPQVLLVSRKRKVFQQMKKNSSCLLRKSLPCQNKWFFNPWNVPLLGKNEYFTPKKNLLFPWLQAGLILFWLRCWRSTNFFPASENSSSYCFCSSFAYWSNFCFWTNHFLCVMIIIIIIIHEDHNKSMTLNSPYSMIN